MISGQMIRASQAAECQIICLQSGDLGWEDPLKEEMATHSSILAWETPWTEESGRPQSMGIQRVGHDYVHIESDDRDR